MSSHTRPLLSLILNILLCFYLLLASSLHLSGRRLHPPALSVGCLSLLVGRLCPSAVAVHRSSSSIGHVCSTAAEPSLGHFWTVSWQSFRHVLAHAQFLGYARVVIRSLLGHVSFRSTLCSAVTQPTVSSPVVPRSSLCRVTISRLYSQSRISAVLSAKRLGRTLGHASQPSLGRRRWLSAVSW